MSIAGRVELDLAIDHVLSQAADVERALVGQPDLHVVWLAIAARFHGGYALPVIAIWDKGIRAPQLADTVEHIVLSEKVKRLLLEENTSLLLS